jgi:hypothetical protein
MKPGEVSEFFFVGAGSMPGLIAWLGDPGLAVIVLVALLLAACLGAMADPEAPFRTMSVSDPPGEPGGEASRASSTRCRTCDSARAARDREGAAPRGRGTAPP